MSLIIQAGFYLVAGLNHFINPEFYLDLIPPYIPMHNLVNLLAGCIEIAFGIGLLVPAFRSVAALGIIMMLVSFIPSHIYFIQIGSCIDDGLCTPEWVGWLRLVLIHPLLIGWAWSVVKVNNHQKNSRQ